MEADVVGMIMDYESGELDIDGVVELFAHLIASGLAWNLQGHYGRISTEMIEGGLISAAGEIDYERVEEVFT